jgi:Domain of unknown function (DUF4351)
LTLQNVADLALFGDDFHCCDRGRACRFQREVAGSQLDVLTRIQSVLAAPQATRPVRSLPPDLPRLSGRHPSRTRRLVNEIPRGTGHADDAQFSAIRGCFTHGRVRFNILIRYRHELPVQSIVVLLRREADSPSLSGEFEDHLPSGFLYHSFRYNVLRVWERPVDEILAGNIATLPLAPIARVSSAELPAVIKRMAQRFKTKADPNEIGDYWAATYVLMGLVYPDSIAKALLEGVRKMKESTTYQAILREGKAEGRLEEAKRILLRQGRKRFGHPKAAVKSKIDAIADLAQLERLSDRVLDANSWDELIDGA